jgi:hypothetical protein
MAFTTVATDLTVLSVNNLNESYDKDLPAYPHPILVKSDDNDVELEKPVSSPAGSANQQNSNSTTGPTRPFIFPAKITPKDFKPLPPLKDDYYCTEIANIAYSTAHCSNCGRREPEDDYLTFCGLFWCIVTFPIGVICLMLCKQKKCAYCGTRMH